MLLRVLREGGSVNRGWELCKHVLDYCLEGVSILLPHRSVFLCPPPHSLSFGAGLLYRLVLSSTA